MEESVERSGDQMASAHIPQTADGASHGARHRLRYRPGIVADSAISRPPRPRPVARRRPDGGGLALLYRRSLPFRRAGFLAEEYVDAHVWPADGFLFRAVKRAERHLIGRAAGIVVLTARAARLLRDWYPRELAAKPLEVIPCCADLRKTVSHNRVQQTAHATSPRHKSLVYVGKLGGRYATRAMVELFAAARRIVPDLHLTVLTQSDAAVLRSHAAQLGLESSITIRRCEHDLLNLELTQADAGLCLYRGDRSAAAVSPTKIAEYLAAGLPVLASSGMGDVDEILLGHAGLPATAGLPQGVGVLVDERDPRQLERGASELVRLIDDPHIRTRCRDAAESTFDLVTIGWRRYQRLYSRIAGHPSPERGWLQFVFRPLKRSRRFPSVNPVNGSRSVQ